MYKIIELFQAPQVSVVVTGGDGVVRYEGDSPSEANRVYKELCMAEQKPKSETKVTAIPWNEKRKPSLDNPDDIKYYMAKLPSRIRSIYHAILTNKPPKEEEIALAQKFHPHYFETNKK